ncbi:MULTISPECIES: class F sortase [unclassified Streptomyces]|uniref:class F sortase n=1 Tax=unclassified Streptomyces TaxID=2593676 RepID=UPI003D74A2AA
MTAGPPDPADGDEPAQKPGPRTHVLAMAAVACAVLAMTVSGGDAEPSGTAAPPPPARASASAPSARPDPTGRQLPRSRPVRLLIPKISVDAPFTDLSIGSSGHLQPPPADDTNLVGWYAAGASPGETGTAIIAGHVDTKTSPAVFVRLGELRKSDVFHVDRADGSTATFVVDDVETFAKDDFPDERVYADAARPEVRLITCAGDYDHAAKDYTDNLVVFAHLV